MWVWSSVLKGGKCQHHSLPPPSPDPLPYPLMLRSFLAPLCSCPRFPKKSLLFQPNHPPPSLPVVCLSISRNELEVTLRISCLFPVKAPSIVLLRGKKVAQAKFKLQMEEKYITALFVWNVHFHSPTFQQRKGGGLDNRELASRKQLGTPLRLVGHLYTISVDSSIAIAQETTSNPFSPHML